MLIWGGFVGRRVALKALISAEKEVTMDNKLSTPPIKSWAVLGDEQMNNDNFPYTMTSKGFQPGEVFFLANQKLIKQKWQRLCSMTETTFGVEPSSHTWMFSINLMEKRPVEKGISKRWLWRIIWILGKEIYRDICWVAPLPSNSANEDTIGICEPTNVKNPGGDY